MSRLRNGDSVSASTRVRATPEEVYSVISDVRRIPEWSPECSRVEVLDDVTFRGHNRRRLGRWTTTAEIVTAHQSTEFTFVVRMMGKPFTRWSYEVEPTPAGSRLTETFTMCQDLSLAAWLFEQVALGVRDRRADLQGNLDQSVRAIVRLVEEID